MHNGINRRAFLRGSALLLGGLAFGRPMWAAQDQRRPTLKFGAISDIHFADLPIHNNRSYRGSADKLAAALESFRDERLDFVVQLGDLIDRTAVDTLGAIDRLRSIDAVYAKAPCERHYVIGNHCAAWLSQNDIIEHSGARASWYSFDVRGFHFVVLDSCYTSTGEPFRYDAIKGAASYFIPPAEMDWLADDLNKTDKPTIVMAHQPLGLPNGHASVKDAHVVRRILSDSGKVTAVFQGHLHRNLYAQLDGIHYCTLTAMVGSDDREDSGHAIVRVFDDGSIRVDGFGRQIGHALDPVSAAMLDRVHPLTRVGRG